MIMDDQDECAVDGFGSTSADNHRSTNTLPPYGSVTTDTLDWSVSGISYISGHGLRPSEVSTSSQTSSHIWDTPIKITSTAPPIQRANNDYIVDLNDVTNNNAVNQLQYLLGSVRDLRSNIRSQNMSKEVSSLCHADELLSSSINNKKNLTNENSAFDKSLQYSNVQESSTQNFNHTPPVKDPGTKLDRILFLMNDLKIARRHLTLDDEGDQANAPSTYLKPPKESSVGHKGRGDSSSDYSKNSIDDSKGNNTVIENYNALHDTDKPVSNPDEIRLRKLLENSNRILINKLDMAENQLKISNEKLEERNEVLTSFGAKWTSLIETLESERASHRQTLQKYQQEIKKYKDQIAERDEKIVVYERELDNAVVLASDFRNKLEEIKPQNKRFSQQISERQIDLEKAKRNINELKEEKKKLLDEITGLKQSNLSQERISQQLQIKISSLNERLEALQHNIQTSKQEREALEKRCSALLYDQQGLESSLHAFYQNEMKSIISKQLSDLRNRVMELELDMNREKMEEIAGLEVEHKKQIDSIKNRHEDEIRKLNQRALDQCVSLQSSLSACRRETDALREQLLIAETSGSFSLTKSDALLPKFNSISFSDISLLNGSLTSEKADFLNSFLKQYFIENPDASSNPKVLSALNGILHKVLDAETSASDKLTIDKDNNSAKSSVVQFS